MCIGMLIVLGSYYTFPFTVIVLLYLFPLHVMSVHFEISAISAARDNKSSMLSHYHKGVFGLHLKGRWGCCGSQQRAAPGCSPVPTREGKLTTSTCMLLTCTCTCTMCEGRIVGGSTRV